jgi:ABC-2 type transport system ATP-binding protein
MNTNMQDVIVATNLAKTYDDGTEALRGIDLRVRKGEIFGLLGPNGAGKTTTVRLLNGAIRPTGGNCRVLDLEAGHDEIRSRTATVAELAQLYEHLSVWENLRFFGTLYGMAAEEIASRADEVLDALEIGDRRETKVGALSTGLRKRVQIARAILHRPSLLFLDEPTSGLDPDSARHVVGLVKSLAEHEGTTVMLCTHNLPLAERICTSYGFIVNGNLQWSGTKDDLADLSGPACVRIITNRGSADHEITRDEEINEIIRREMDAGALISEVRKLEPTLEESYFAIVNGENHERAAS